MNAKSHVARAADILALGVVVTLAGCAGAVTRQSTGESLYTPAFASSDVTDLRAPVAVTTVAPNYPFAMRCLGIETLVNVNCLIDENGTVAEAHVGKDADARFSEAALAAVTRWRFAPGQRNGIPAPTRVNIPIKFTLQDLQE